MRPTINHHLLSLGWPDGRLASRTRSTSVLSRPGGVEQHGGVGDVRGGMIGTRHVLGWTKDAVDFNISPPG